MSNGDIFPMNFLTSDWADQKVTKDPPRWTGDSCVGLNYSECPISFLEEMAGFLDWKVGKDKEKQAQGKPVAMQTRGKNAGKPFYERDIFTAKLLRTWAASKVRGAASVGQDVVKDLDDPTFNVDEDIPF